MDYFVKRAFMIPQEVRGLASVDEGLKTLCGINEAIPENTLTKIVVSAADFDEEWLVSAFVDAGTVAKNDVMAGQISCNIGICRSQVLKIAEMWIRASEAYIPSRALELPVDYPFNANRIVSGIILVRHA